MKIASGAADRFVAQPDAAAILIYGPDRGLARERAQSVFAAVGVDITDPFAFTELSEDGVKADPASLIDAMRALAFGGGARAVRVRVGGDAAAGALDALVRALDADEFDPTATLVVEAGDLTPRSRLRKAFEAARRSAAVPCYADGPKELERLIDDAMSDAGLSIDPEARAALVPHLEGDRALARAELDKLATYMGPQPGSPVSIEDVEDCATGADRAEFNDVLDAAFTGDTAQADDALGRALAAGAAPIGVVRAVQRHVMALTAAARARANGASVNDAMKTMRPPVFGPRRSVVQRQIERWPPRRLTDALARTVALERELKTTSPPDVAVVGRLIIAIANAARSTR